MRNLLFILFVIVLSYGAMAQSVYQDDLHYRVEIDLKALDISNLTEAGVELCHAFRTDRHTLITELSGQELSWLADYAGSIEILIEDMESYYQNRISKEMAELDISTFKSGGVSQFSLGSMGGQKTLDEVLSDLDSMASRYPDLITERFSIGQSYEGREIWAVMMGTEMDSIKPMAMYNSLIHAREPSCMMAVVYYMWWLLENYGVDEEATFILDNRHLAFIPVLNPDGYEYNRTIAPDGGGLQRKNRRPVGDNWQGVDLNRNFGPQEFWDHISGGSSTNPGSQIYRGEAPFSEPETQALKAFVEAFDFKTAFNYHSFSDLLIYPYGVTEELPKDSVVFLNYGRDMTKENGYLLGTALQTVGYKVRGVADDWFYGPEEGNENGRAPIISFTPEVGSFNDGFWPAPSRIISLCEDNLLANQLLSRYAGPELVVDPDQMPEVDQTTLLATEVNRISFTFNQVHNYGRTAFDGAYWRLSSSSEYVDVLIDEQPFGELLPGDFVSGQTSEFLVNAVNPEDTSMSVELMLELVVPGSFTQASWIFTLPIEAMPTSVQSENQINTTLSSSPNPFEEQTVISFEVLNDSNVSFTLVDMNGRVVYRSGNQVYGAGHHDFLLSGEHLVKGTYILQMRVGHHVVNRRLVKQ